MHFADESREIAGVSEVVGYGFMLWGKWRGVIGGFEVVGVEAGHDGGARWAADRVSAIGVGEAHALACEGVEVWSYCCRVAGDPHAAALMPVGHEEEDVEARAVGRRRGCGHRSVDAEGADGGRCS